MDGMSKLLLHGYLSKPGRAVRPRVQGIPEWRFAPGLRGCKLCGTSVPCGYRTIYSFGDAEYDVVDARLAVYCFAYGLGWKEREFYPNLLSVLSAAKVHFMDYGSGPYDLELSPFECERDAYELKSENDLDKLRQWFGDTFNQITWIDSMPALRGIGKQRFMLTASILIAAYPELEAELERIANRNRPVS